jgi:predicted HTH domain antitoxin
MSDEPTEELVPLAEAARVVGMSTLAVLRLVVRREVPSVSTPRGVCIPRTVVDGFSVPADYVPVAEEARRLGVVSLIEARERLGVDEDTFARLVLDRRLPHVFVQGEVHIPVEAIETYRRAS